MLDFIFVSNPENAKPKMCQFFLLLNEINIRLTKWVEFVGQILEEKNHK